jgi:hypothetical protein
MTVINEICNIIKVLDEWTELPQITPEQITIGRKLRLIMSGDLNSTIESYP